MVSRADDPVPLRGDERLEERHLDTLARTVADTGKQGGEDRLHGQCRAVGVCERDDEKLRWPVTALPVHHARHRLEHDV